MDFLEFGNNQNKKIIFIHGMQVPWQIWKPFIDQYSKEYHIIIPILDGHNPKAVSIFSSIEKEAELIENYYIERFGNEIYAICGISMGGTIAANIWKNDRLQFKKLFLDGAPLVPQNKMLTSILINQYLNLTHKSQERHPKTLNKCEESFIPKKYMLYFLEMIDCMSDATIKNCVNSVGSFQLPTNLKMDNMEISYVHGTAINELVSKKSATYLKKHYPKANVCCLNGYSHCDLVLRNPEKCIEIIEEFLLN